MPAPISSLPLDIAELVLSAIEDPTDLLSLALTSKDWKALIVPRHIEYRRLRITPEEHHVWAHLAERPDLAQNVRHVDFREGKRESKLRLPRTLLSTSCDPIDAEGRDDGRFVQTALKNMIQLGSFRWERVSRIWTGKPWEVTRRVFDTLRQSKTLRNLKIDATSTTSRELEEVDFEFPLWNVSILETLSLIGIVRSVGTADSHLNSMLSRSENIQSLSMSYDPRSPSFTSCHFPCLRSLRLKRLPNSYGNNAEENDVLDFLIVHSTIETLQWSPSENTAVIPGLLPALQKLWSTNMFMTQFLRDNTVSRKFTTLGDLTLDPEMTQVLGTLDGSTLEELYVFRQNTVENLEMVAEMFPNINLLELPGYGLAPYGAKKAYSLDDYIFTLSHFQNLKTLQLTVIWPLLDFGMDTDALHNLAKWCPKLGKLTFQFMNEIVEVFLVREAENGRISWKRGIKDVWDD